MPNYPSELTPGEEHAVLLPYVADLEAEVDRLRRQATFLDHESHEALSRIRKLCEHGKQTAPELPALREIESTILELGSLLRDLGPQRGFHPAMDQVVPIAVRPVIEQVFRWHQRLQGAAEMALRLELDIEHVEWFPARFRHIVDGLLANALRHGAPREGEARVSLALRQIDRAYELRVTDNGPGMANTESRQILDLFHRAGPARAAGLGVGLAVTKRLAEQSGGSLTIESGEGRGTTCVAVLPQFSVDDYLG